VFQNKIAIKLRLGPVDPGPPVYSYGFLGGGRESLQELIPHTRCLSLLSAHFSSALGAHPNSTTVVDLPFSGCRYDELKSKS
jgi:hypothetical protein